MRDLIVFGEDLGGLPSSTQHLVKRLADDRQVLWINSIGLRQPRINRRDLSRVWQKLRPVNLTTHRGSDTPHSAPGYSEHHGGHITQANLLTIPAPRSPLARRVARDVMLHQLMPLVEQLGMQRPILWSSLPTAADLCTHLDHSGVVYYCGDDFSSLAGVDHTTVSQHEQTLVEQADLILVASEKLRHKFPERKTHLLPHGVDTQLFSQPAPRANDLPQTNGPIAGFYGSVSEWLDFELIDYCATALPDWQFVFIGPICVEPNRLPLHANIHYLGPRPHHQLPSYSQHWDVSMLPFLNNEQIHACNPLKLLEYLAAGQPVVSVDFPALSPYRRHLHTAESNTEKSNSVENKAQFVQSLQIACHSPRIPPSAIQGQSWDDRSAFLNWMLELL